MSYRTIYRIAVAPVALLAVLSTSGLALAHDEGSPAGAAGVKAEILTWIKDAEGKLTELAEAMPERKYGWSPAKGVRTVGDVFMHVAAANYGVPSFLGVPPPKGFDFMTFEHSMTAKSDIIKTLSASFAHMETAFQAMSDADIETAEFFGMKTTARGAYLLLLSHAHEHLGQAIAYARSNKMTPPWTARQTMAEAKGKGKATNK